MDYKVIIILLALLFLIILVYREVSVLKDQFGKNAGQMSLQFRQNTDKMLLKFQNNMNKYVSQIKTISSDNLQQLRKITILNHQPVTRLSNHFTETDNSEMKTDIQYLSDVREPEFKTSKKQTEKNNTVFERKEEHQYYMSEDTKKTKESDENVIESENEDQDEDQDENLICDGDKCYIKKDNIDDHKETENIPIYHQNNDSYDIPIYTKTKNLTSEQKNNIIEDDDNSADYETDNNDDDNDTDDENDNNDNTSELVNVSMQKYHIKTKDFDKDMNIIATSTPQNLENSMIDDDDNYTSEENITLPISKNKHRNDMDIDIFNMLSKKTNNISDELSKIIKEVSSDKLDKIYINEEDNQITKKQTDEKTSEVCSEDTFNVEANVHKIDLSESIHNMINNSKNSTKDSDKNTDEDSETNQENKHDDDVIKHDTINIPIDDQIKKARAKKIDEDDGMETKSKHSKTSKMSTVSFMTIGGTRKKRPVLSIKTNTDDGDGDDNDNEIININRNKHIENINIKGIILKPYESYTFNDLRVMARKLSIPTTYKEKNKTKQYKKDELYDHIEKSLNSTEK